MRNITVGISLGAERELSFEKMDSHEVGKVDVDGKATGGKSMISTDEHIRNRSDQLLAARISVPQTNNSVSTIGRDVNIRFKHGIVESGTDRRGRIGIILWGQVQDIKEEDGSPAQLKC